MLLSAAVLFIMIWIPGQGDTFSVGWVSKHFLLLFYQKIVYLIILCDHFSAGDQYAKLDYFYGRIGFTINNQISHHSQWRR